MKLQIKELIKQIEDLNLESVASNKEDLSRLQEITRLQLKKLHEHEYHKQMQLKASRKEFLLKESKWTEPVYEDMGVVSHKGSCFFQSEEDAKELIEALKEESYYYGHSLNWTGPGVYDIWPTTSTDHDRETIYLATYTKRSN